MLNVDTYQVLYFCLLLQCLSHYTQLHMLVTLYLPTIGMLLNVDTCYSTFAYSCILVGIHMCQSLHHICLLLTAYLHVYTCQLLHICVLLFICVLYYLCPCLLHTHLVQQLPDICQLRACKCASSMYSAACLVQHLQLISTLLHYVVLSIKGISKSATQQGSISFNYPFHLIYRKQTIEKKSVRHCRNRIDFLVGHGSSGRNGLDAL